MTNSIDILRFLENPKFNVVLFDIFDTLLLRPYRNPQFVWDVLEREEHASGFAEERRKADAITYRGAIERGGETTIAEAYSLMPDKYQALLTKELELEKRILRANPEMLNLWNEVGALGKKRIIVSDMYLPQSFLEDVLRANGIDNWDAFFLSSTYNVRKESGALFTTMLREMDLTPQKVLHIGDNPESDRKVPEKLGIKVLPYENIHNKFQYEFPFSSHIDCHLAGCLSIGWHNYKIQHPNFTYWNKLGFILGGVLGYMYVRWIAQTMSSLGKHRILFVARDGYILKKVCEELYPEIAADYIYAPRMTSIAVNGVAGNNPYAVRDRQAYYDINLRDADIDKIKKDYEEYISTLHIDDDCVLVDGCSSEFSAQKLLESMTGQKIFTFYLLSMAKMHNAGALFSTHLYSMPFQMISEFIFGSPESPIISVGREGPEYKQEISRQERFKMSVSEEIAQGVVECARVLKHEDIQISAGQWIQYSNEFMRRLTEDDKAYLVHAENAADVCQNSFNGVIWNPDNKLFSITHVGKIGRTFTLLLREKLYKLTVSHKGINTYFEDRHHQEYKIEL